MDQVVARVTAALGRFLGLPRGAGVLFPRLRGQLTAIVLGTLLLAHLEVVALAFAYAALQVTSAETATELPATLRTVVGDTPLPTAAAIFGAGVLLAYVLKAVLNTVFTWWTGGVLMRVQVDMSSTILSRFLRAPYALHLGTSSADILCTVNDAVAKVYAKVVAGLAEAFTITMVTIPVFVAAPVPTAVGALYFLVAVPTFQRWARPRLIDAGRQSQRGTQQSYRAAMEAYGAVREVQLSGNEDYFVERFRAARERSARADRITSLLAAVPRDILEVLFAVGVGLMGLVVFRSGLSSTVMMSSLGVVALGGFRVLPSINRLMASLNLVQGGGPRGRRGLPVRAIGIPGAGGLQLIDRDDVAGDDDPGSEVLVYRDIDQACELATRALSDRPWTRSIARAGRRRTRAAEHTLDHRVHQLEALWTA